VAASNQVMSFHTDGKPLWPVQKVYVPSPPSSPKRRLPDSFKSTTKSAPRANSAAASAALAQQKAEASEKKRIELQRQREERNAKNKPTKAILLDVGLNDGKLEERRKFNEKVARRNRMAPSENDLIKLSVNASPWMGLFLTFR